METKIISIDISPENYGENQTENAGLMWEHNATAIVFNINEKYIGEYKYYIEYRSLIGTKVRTEYLDIDPQTNTVTYNIPVTMSSLKGVECYFNVVLIDDDGATAQVIKAQKFCLQFDYSPDTDNSIAKVNDFSINALLEAIRLGTFKGDKGDKGDTGDKGEKGDKGETGEISYSYAAENFATAVKSELTGNPVIIEDASSLQHSLYIKTTPNQMVCLRRKNLIPFVNNKFNNGNIAGKTYKINGVSFTINYDGSVTANGTATEDTLFPIMDYSSASTGVHTVTLSGSPTGASADTYCLRLSKGADGSQIFEDYGKGKTVYNVRLTGCLINIVVKSGVTIDTTFYPMLEFGKTASKFVSPGKIYTADADENGVVDSFLSLSPYMCVFTDTNADVTCSYNGDTTKILEKAKNEIEEQIEAVKEQFEDFDYRLINTETLESDSQLAVFTEDTEGNAIKNLNLKKMFILFTGKFMNTTSSQPLCVLFNDGKIYQMYKTFNITADSFCGLWFESEKIISLSDRDVYKSVYPSTLLGNFNATTELAQGLNPNNTAVYSDLSVTTNVAIEKIAFGSFNSNNLMKSGSKIYLFGV